MSTAMALPVASDWTAADIGKVELAIAEHRLSRVDLFFWGEIDLRGRSAMSVAQQTWLTERQVRERLERARLQVAATLGRPAQAPYLGRWLD